MHLFLTGEIRIGKSTVITKTLELLNVSFGGFRTYFGADRANPNRLLYMCDASRPYRCDERHVVARFQQPLPPAVHPGNFDDFGALYIKHARENARLIVMDECGGLEQSAKIFQAEIFTALDGPVPVLGVVKLSAGGWTDELRRHPKVRLIVVTIANRDSLPALLAESLKHDLRA